MNHIHLGYLNLNFRVITIFFGRHLAKDKKRFVEEVSEGLYSSASLTSGEEDGQEEPSDLDEPCGQEGPCHTVPGTVLPPLRSPSPWPDATLLPRG